MLEKVLVERQLVKSKNQLLKQFVRQYVNVDKTMSTIDSLSARASQERTASMTPAKRNAEKHDSYHKGQSFKNRCKTPTVAGHTMVNLKFDLQNVERPLLRNNKRKINHTVDKSKTIENAENDLDRTRRGKTEEVKRSMMGIKLTDAEKLKIKNPQSVGKEKIKNIIKKQIR